MAKVILYANKRAGLEVCKFLKQAGDEIVRLYVLKTNNEDAEETAAVSGLEQEHIFNGKQSQESEHQEFIENEKPDFIITVYWPYLLSKPIIESAQKGSINFHPAYLPINRGWYPHVHSLVDGSPAGVTLHALSEEADKGPVWAQERVSIEPIDTAKTLHEKLQSQIIELFKKSWSAIKSGELSPQPQDESQAVYHDKAEVNAMDEIKMDETYKAKDLINLLKARSFGDKGFAYYVDQGKKVYLNLSVSYEDGAGK